MKTEIKHKWTFDQSVEEIWEYLTKAELIEEWLMPNDFKLVIGYEFKFITKPISSLGLDGNFYCKVLEFVPLKKLVYSWQGGPKKGKITLDTVLEWTLEPKQNGTELSLIHRGFNKENQSILTAMFDGWNENIKKMLEHLKSDRNDNTKS